jgi:hypothetical protein
MSLVERGSYQRRIQLVQHLLTGNVGPPSMMRQHSRVARQSSARIDEIRRVVRLL